MCLDCSKRRYRLSSRICAVFQVIFRSLKYILVDTITTRYRVLCYSVSSTLARHLYYIPYC
ncbi:hypothetical protein CO2235_230208 [Cupriavidus oxalaticus]|uniref:Uncharacterized protein n=1 Tax=Cupriavidus oxalaticus TaxID=96344 RepID=A0A976GAV4_9BURK|nr:hypothetical protein CO2235_230208 [Cupriavidus oxalaticus]